MDINHVLLVLKGKLNQNFIDTHKMGFEKVEWCMKEVVKENPGLNRDEVPIAWMGHMNNLKEVSSLGTDTSRYRLPIIIWWKYYKDYM